MDLAVPRLRGLIASRLPVCRSTSHSTRLDVTTHLRRWVRPPGLSNLVRATGFEPATPRIRNECATRLRYALTCSLTSRTKLGRDGETRTPKAIKLSLPKRDRFHLRGYVPIQNLQSGRLKLLLCWEFHNPQSPDALQRGGCLLSQRLATPRTLGGVYGRNPENGRIVFI
jgi:hypothetical protein